MSISVSREEVGESLVLSVDGSVDIASSPELRGALRVAVEARHPRVVVDLGGVGFVDSSGLATLIEALQGTKKNGGDLRLCCLSKSVLGVFQLANLHNIFAITETRQEAIDG